MLPVGDAMLDACRCVSNRGIVVETREGDVLERQVLGLDRRLPACVPVGDHLVPRLADAYSTGDAVAATHLRVHACRDLQHEQWRQLLGRLVGRDQRPQA